ncbi:MAG: selenocysteine-specific translation elongation factor [Candidatus Obscuribacterales bacterium]|nr:selenocysteine-specific translation elongation factor [Candidatus Obscuribacterales bacterium]
MNTSAPLQFKTGTRFFTIATAGHVDHGKTSLLKKLTGIDPDRLKEEKERQMTTDLGFAYLPLSGDLVLGFVDVPGHGKFLKNMLAGVGGIDIALLVVAADEGPMPQTRQHVRILSLLGVKEAVVALTKIDLVEEPEQVELVKEEVENLLLAHGIKALAFCPLSSTTGEGIDRLEQKLKDILERAKEPAKKGSLLLPVDRVFSKAGFGTVITGTLVKGKLAVGDQIFVEPGNLSARVRRLESHGQSLNEAGPGQRVACNIVVKDGVKLRRGHVLSGKSISPTRSMIVSLLDKPRLLKQDLSERLSDQPIRLYHGTAEYQGYLRWVEDRALEESATAGDQKGFALVALQDDAVISALDRFVIRLTDDTIYGGEILLRERPRWLSKSEILKLAALLDAGNYKESLHLYLDDSPHLMLKEEQLTAILPEAHLERLVSDGVASGELCRLGDYLLSMKSRQELGEKLRAKTAEILSSAEESSDGAGLELVRSSMHPRLERVAFQLLLEDEVGRGGLLRHGDKISLPGAKALAPVSAQQSGAEAKILEVLSEHWCLEVDDLANLAGVDLKTAKSALNALSKSGEVVIASYDFIARQSKIDEAHQILSDLWNAKRVIAPTDFKEKLGVTRKYAMALLQYFDDSKVTRRLDSGRVLLKGPKRS